MARPTEKYIEPIQAETKAIASSLFGNDVKKRLEEEKRLIENLEALRNDAVSLGDEEIVSLLDACRKKLAEDRERMGRIRKAIEKK